MKEDLYFHGIKGVIRNQDGKFLLVEVKSLIIRDNISHYWDLIGGRIDPGSGVEETLQRQINEEIGEHSLSVLGFVGLGLSNMRIPYENVDYGLFLSVYDCEVSDIQIRLNAEYETYGWFDLDDALVKLSIKYPKELLERIKHYYETLDERRTRHIGHIFRFLQKQVDVGGGRKKLFEVVERAPGVRVLIEKDNKILLTREHRYEIDTFDYRLPGGKMVDTIEQYAEFLQSGKDLLEGVKEAGIREVKEETGILIEELELVYKDIVGTTVRRDLYYLRALKFDDAIVNQSLEDGEYISTDRYTYEQVLDLMKTKQMTESRTKAFLYDYILGNDVQNK